jgi:hypothetical protein
MPMITETFVEVFPNREHRGGIFQIKMTPNQITMTAYEEDPFLIIFLRFDSNSLIGIKSGNFG